MDFKEVLTKEFLLTYTGRINRQRYWAYVLVAIAIAIVASIIDGILGGQVVGTLVSLAMLYPGICVSIKRWHDRDKSGWWILIVLIPIVGWIWSFVEVGCLKGTDGSNRFGADPLAGAPAA